MGRVISLIYGLIAYGLFLASFMYAVGFVGDLSLVVGGTELFPKTISRGGAAVVGFDASAFLINALLLGAFAIQHSVMARPWFKTMWTKVVRPPIERSTYVLLASLLLMLLYWQWRPMTQIIWDASGNEFLVYALWILFGIGWFVVLISTFMINHWDLFGLRQTVCHARGIEPEPLEFQTRGLYSYCRHPIMLGFIIAFWAIPNMTLGHLIFAIATTAYIFVALQFEERDMLRAHVQYTDYKRSVPMLVPLGRRRRE